MHTSPSATTPRVAAVGVEELRSAWKAVEAGFFDRTIEPAARPHAPSVAPATGSAPDTWAPGVDESVVVVRGCLGSAGATTVALALATASASAARLVECCPAWASGLTAAASAELGEEGAWRRGRRGGVQLEWRHVDEAGVPLPSDAHSGLTVLDLGAEMPSGWAASALAETPALALVTRATVPGLRRLERELERHASRNPVAAVIGPPFKRWPKVLTRAVGDHTHFLIRDGRLIGVPVDRTLALTGLTPDPLPPALVRAGGRLLTLLGKEPS